MIPTSLKLQVKPAGDRKTADFPPLNLALYHTTTERSTISFKIIAISIVPIVFFTNCNSQKLEKYYNFVCQNYNVNTDNKRITKTNNLSFG